LYSGGEWGKPTSLELDVGGEVDLVQVVVDEVPDVPGQVVMPEQHTTLNKHNVNTSTVYSVQSP
jgi:hypothetical protein